MKKDTIKIKGRKLNNVNAIHLPCTTKQYNDLRDGKAVEVNKEVGSKLLSMGLAEKATKKEK